MATKVFINLPVTNLPKSIKFFESLGYRINPQFSDDTGACVVISEEIYTMLLTHDKWRQFTPKPIPDATKTNEVIVALSCDDRGEVDRICDQAFASGAGKFGDPQDLGFMYLRSFADLDGHIWEYCWMDAAAVAEGPPQE